MMKRNRNSRRKLITGLSVEVGDNFERSFRIFNKKVQESGLLREIRERSHYISDSEKRKKSKKMAKKRWQKKLATLDVRSQKSHKR